MSYIFRTNSIVVLIFSLLLCVPAGRAALTEQESTASIDQRELHTYPIFEGHSYSPHPEHPGADLRQAETRDDSWGDPNGSQNGIGALPVEDAFGWIILLTFAYGIYIRRKLIRSQT